MFLSLSSLPLRWLVYAHPFFQGLPRVLEVGGFPNPASWGVEQPYVGSLHPLKVVSAAVTQEEKPSESLEKCIPLIVSRKLICIYSLITGGTKSGEPE